MACGEREVAVISRTRCSIARHGRKSPEAESWESGPEAGECKREYDTWKVWMKVFWVTPDRKGGAKEGRVNPRQPRRPDVISFGLDSPAPERPQWLDTAANRSWNESMLAKFGTSAGADCHSCRVVTGKYEKLGLEFTGEVKDHRATRTHVIPSDMISSSPTQWSKWPVIDPRTLG